MVPLLLQILGGLCLVAAIVLAFIYVERGAYQRGHQKGWIAAQEWIVKFETEVDKARQEIWRSER